MNKTYIILEENIYEIGGYINKHPGEGISNVYLEKYKGRDCTKDFNKYHMTDEAFELLENAKENGCCNHINYICKNCFQGRIPKYFYYNKDDIDGNIFLENNNIVLIPENDNIFLLKYKINGLISEDKIIQVTNKFLYTRENALYNNIEIIVNKKKKELEL